MEVLSSEEKVGEVIQNNSVTCKRPLDMLMTKDDYIQVEGMDKTIATDAADSSHHYTNY